MKLWLIALLLLLPVVALAVTVESSSKLNSYAVLAPGPAASALASKVVTYAVLDSTPAYVGSTKINTYVVLDGAPSIIGADKLNTYVVIAPRLPGAGFFRAFP